MTHSITNTVKRIGIRSMDNAGIPMPQPPHPSIQFGKLESSAAAVVLDHDFVQLINTNAFAVDVSGWKLDGGLAHQMKPGTVIPSGQALYLSPNVAAFRARSVSPRKAEGCFVQGNYQRRPRETGQEQLMLRDEAGTLIATTRFTPGS